MSRKLGVTFHPSSTWPGCSGLPHLGGLWAEGVPRMPSPVLQAGSTEHRAEGSPQSQCHPAPLPRAGTGAQGASDEPWRPPAHCCRAVGFGRLPHPLLKPPAQGAQCRSGPCGDTALGQVHRVACPHESRPALSFPGFLCWSLDLRAILEFREQRGNVASPRRETRGAPPPPCCIYCPSHCLCPLSFPCVSPSISSSRPPLSPFLVL